MTPTTEWPRGYNPKWPILTHLCRPGCIFWDFQFWPKILGKYLKGPKSRFSPALKSDFLLEGWAEFLQGIFLVTKEALCKISAKSSNKKLENWHPKNHDFRTFFKNPSIWPISENFKKCPFFVAISIFYPRIPPKSSLLADFTPFMSTWKPFCEKVILADFVCQNLQTTSSGWLLGLDPL